jgi:hypothetical protein
MNWKKQVPNKAGYWLRVNAGHHVGLHHVFTTYRDPKFKRSTGLEIIWGWGGSEKACRVKDIENKLKCFWWYGPLPEPPKEAL